MLAHLGRERVFWYRSTILETGMNYSPGNPQLQGGGDVETSKPTKRTMMAKREQ